MTGFEAAFYIASVGAVISFLLVTILVSDPESTDAEAADDFSITILGSRGGLDPIFTLALASLFMAISIALLSTLETTINKRLDQSSFWFGVEFAAFVLAQVALQTPIGHASDRYGRRQFIIAGLVLLIPATVAQGFVDTTVQMLIARLVQGIAGALVFAPALALAGDIARKGQSGTQLSLLTMAFGLGTAIGPLSSGFLVKFGFPHSVRDGWHSRGSRCRPRVHAGRTGATVLGRPASATGLKTVFSPLYSKSASLSSTNAAIPSRWSCVPNNELQSRRS